MLCIQVACFDWYKAYCKICETQFVLTSFLCYHSKILFWKETWTVRGLKIWDVVKCVCLAQGVPINRGIQWRFWYSLDKWLIELVWWCLLGKSYMPYSQIQYSVPLHYLSCRNVTKHHTTFSTITAQSFTVYIKYTLADVTLFRPLTWGSTTLILNKGDFEFV